MADVMIWGGKGHARVLRPILEDAGYRVVLVFDQNPAVPAPFTDIPFLTEERALDEWVATRPSNSLGFVIAVGGENGRERCRLAQSLVQRGVEPVSAIHQRSWVARSALLGAGCHVLAMAAVCVDARLGVQCIVNTNASIDHECIIGDGVHIMPGATLAGCVEVENFATIGSNATVLPRVRIGEEAVVGAGAVVIDDVPPRARVVGSPAHRI